MIRMASTPKTFFVGLSVLGTIFVAIGLAIAAYLAIDAARFRARSVATTGTVVEIRPTIVDGGDGSTETVYSAVLPFEAGEYEWLSPYIDEDPSSAYPVGSTVVVHYVPGDPETYSIDLEKLGL